MEEKETARESRDQRKQRELSEKIDQLNSLRGLDFEEVIGYVYREVFGGGRQALPPVENIASDHDFGQLYGPGKYMVLYEVVLEDNGERVKRTIRYNIGPEYAAIHKQYCLENNRPCLLDSYGQQGGRGPGFQISDYLTEDKVKGLIGLLGAVKMILGSRNDSESETLKFMLEQQSKTLQAVLTQKPAASSMPDTLVSEAFKLLTHRQEPKNHLATMREQLDFMRDLQGITNPAPIVEEKELSPLEKLFEKALEIIPGLLQQHNGNIEKAAAAAKKQHPFITSFLKNRDAQRGAYSGLVKKYGKEAADRWAAGFGIDPSVLTAVDAEFVRPSQGAKPKTESGVKIL